MTWSLATQTLVPKLQNVKMSQKENLVMEVHPRDFLPKRSGNFLSDGKFAAHGSLSAPARVGVGVAAPASHERAASSHERAATTLASDFDALHDG